MSKEEVARIVAVGKEHTAPDIPFYTWGRAARLEEFTLTDKYKDEAAFQRAYNNELGGGANAGPGLYLSPLLHDTPDYCPARDGALLQVDVPDDVPYIDMLDKAVMKDLKRGEPSIVAQMLYRQIPDIPPVLVRYTGVWHCLKTIKQVRFRMFDGRGVSALTVQNSLNSIRAAGFHVAAAVLLAQLRPDMSAQVH